jgi:hypothetical protein
VAVSANHLNASIPAQSVTLFVVPRQTAPPPALSINDVTVTEGNGGTTMATFTVSLSGAGSEPVSVSYATANGTASAGTDYVATAGSLSFAAGTTTRTLSVAVNGDTTVEADETFFVNLTAPTGATLADAQGKATLKNDDSAAVPSIAVSPTTVQPGQTVQVTVANGPGQLRDWVGLYPAAAADSGYLAWKYLSGTQTPPPAGLAGATLSFVMPQAPGTYNFRLFLNNGFTKLATSAAVTVAGASAGTPTVTVNVSTVAAGQTVQVTVANGPGSSTDWLGLYRTGTADLSYLDWKYLSGARTPPPTGLTGATVPFVMPTTTGTYEFRLFKNNGMTRLATSAAVTVTGPSPGGATLSAGAASVPPGGSIVVTFANAPGNRTDWIGLYLAGTGDAAYRDWKYLNGTRAAPASAVIAGSVTFTMPPSAGTYEFRLFANNGMTKLATSGPVTVP